jgi:hypothetical protein
MGGEREVSPSNSHFGGFHKTDDTEVVPPDVKTTVFRSFWRDDLCVVRCPRGQNANCWCPQKRIDAAGAALALYAQMNTNGPIVAAGNAAVVGARTAGLYLALVLVGAPRWEGGS